MLNFENVRCKSVAKFRVLWLELSRNKSEGNSVIFSSFGKLLLCKGYLIDKDCF